MTTAFDDALDVLYGDVNLAVDVAWTPAGADEAVMLRGLAELGEVTGSGGAGFGAVPVQAPRVYVRRSEVLALAPGVDLAKGDGIEIEGESYEINGSPSREDARRAEWMIPLAALE